LTVTDVDSIIEWNMYLKEKNVPFVVDVTEMELINKRAIIVKDPNGVQIELSESM